jgi:hypothetical protein
MAHQLSTDTPSLLAMKTLRLLVALVPAIVLVSPVVRASDDKVKDKAEAVCHCGKDKDGKECGKDKECCCKAKEHCDDKKAGEKK